MLRAFFHHRIIAGKIHRLITKALLHVYRSMQRRFPATLWHGDESRREIALTFDDGPHPRDTPGVLDVLAKHDVHATFFLIGRDVERVPHLVREIHERGHLIGIHCHRHIPFPLENPQVLRAHLDGTRHAIAGLCGVAPETIRDVRPPYGFFTKNTLSLLTRWKYRLVMWNCIPPHFTQPLSWTIQQVLDSSIPGSIIVLHDGHGHGSKAAQIVDTIVPKVKSQGIDFVTIEHMQSLKYT